MKNSKNYILEKKDLILLMNYKNPLKIVKNMQNNC